MSVTAKKMDVQSVNNTTVQDTQNNFKQNGVTVSLSVPIIDSVNGLVNTAKTVGKSSNSRVNTMAMASTAIKAHDAAQDMQGLSNAKGLSDVTKGVSLSISLGSQKNQSSQHTDGSEVVSSVIKGKYVELLTRL